MDRRFDRSRRVSIVTLHMRTWYAVPLHDLRPTSVHVTSSDSAEMFVAWNSNVFNAYFVAAQMRRLALHALYASFSAFERLPATIGSIGAAGVKEHLQS